MPIDDGWVPTKPGWQTTEFWLSLAAVAVSYLLTTDLVGGDFPVIAKALTIIAAVLATLGYTASRAVVKKAQMTTTKKE